MEALRTRDLERLSLCERAIESLEMLWLALWLMLWRADNDCDKLTDFDMLAIIERERDCD